MAKLSKKQVEEIKIQSNITWTTADFSQYAEALKKLNGSTPDLPDSRDSEGNTWRDRERLL